MWWFDFLQVFEKLLDVSNVDVDDKQEYREEVFGLSYYDFNVMGNSEFDFYLFRLILKNNGEVVWKGLFGVVLDINSVVVLWILLMQLVFLLS